MKAESKRSWSEENCFKQFERDEMKVVKQVDKDGFREDRKLTQSKLLNDLQEAAKQIPGSPQKIQKNAGVQQSSFLEQWLGDVLRDAEEHAVAGLLRRPEHIAPIRRYQIDKQTLQTLGLSTEMQSRIYQSLYVHSIGFHAFVKELTKHVVEGRAALRVNIWKVFQILLECACKTDYKLITQRLEEQNVVAIEHLSSLNEDLMKQNYKKEDQLRIAMRDVVEGQKQLNQGQADLTIERQRLQDLQTEQRARLEEEVLTRMKFEQKLNVLHNINLQTQSQNMMFRWQNEKLQFRVKTLENENEKMKEENKHLKKRDLEITKEINEYQMHEKIENQKNNERQIQWNDMLLKLDTKKIEVQESTEQYHISQEKLLTMQMKIVNMKQMIEEKEQAFDKLNKFYQKSLEDIVIQNEKIESMSKKYKEYEDEIVQTKTKYQDNLRKNQMQQRQIEALEIEVNDLQEKNDRLKIQCTTQEQKIEIMSIDNGQHDGRIKEMDKMVKEFNSAKSVLEKQLASQMNQCAEQQDKLEYFKTAYKKLKRLELLESTENKYLLQKTGLRDTQLSTALENIEIISKERDGQILKSKQILIKSEDLQREAKKSVTQMQMQMQSWQRSQLDHKQKISDQKNQISTLNIKVESFQKENKILSDKYEKVLGELTQFNDEQETLKFENKELKKNMVAIEQLNRNIKQVIEKKVSDQKQILNRREMELEDQISKHYNKCYKQKLLIESLMKDNRYLSKQFIGYLFLKGWSRARRQAYEQEVHKNKILAKAQEEDINRQMIQLKELSEKKVEMESKMSKYNVEMQKKDQLISELEKANEEYKVEKEENLEEINYLREQLDEYDVVKEDKEVQVKLVVEKPVRSIGTDTSMEEVDLGEGEANLNASAKNMFKHFLKNQESGELTEYQIGEEIPDGFQVVKKKQSQKKKRPLKQLMTKFKIAVEAAKMIAEHNKQLNKVKPKSQETDLESKQQASDDTQNEVNEYQQSSKVKSTKKVAFDSDFNSIQKEQSQENQNQSSSNTILRGSDIHNTEDSIQEFDQDSQQKSQEKTLDLQDLKNIYKNQMKEKLRERLLKKSQSSQDNTESVSKEEMSASSLEQSSPSEDDEVVVDAKELEQLNNTNNNIMPEEEGDMLTMRDQEIIEYLSKRTQKQIQPLVNELNQINQVKCCGHLGMCFNCRNKDIGIHNNQHFVKENQDIDKQKTFYQRSESSPSLQHQKMFMNNISIQKNHRRKTYGDYFKKELQKILKDYEPSVSNVSWDKSVQYDRSNLNDDQMMNQATDSNIDTATHALITDFDKMRVQTAGLKNSRNQDINQRFPTAGLMNNMNRTQPQLLIESPRSEKDNVVLDSTKESGGDPLTQQLTKKKINLIKPQNSTKSFLNSTNRSSFNLNSKDFNSNYQQSVLPNGKVPVTSLLKQYYHSSSHQIPSRTKLKQIQRANKNRLSNDQNHFKPQNLQPQKQTDIAQKKERPETQNNGMRVRSMIQLSQQKQNENNRYSTVNQFDKGGPNRKLTSQSKLQTFKDFENSIQRISSSNSQYGSAVEMGTFRNSQQVLSKRNFESAVRTSLSNLKTKKIDQLRSHSQIMYPIQSQLNSRDDPLVEQRRITYQGNCLDLKLNQPTFFDNQLIATEQSQIFSFQNLYSKDLEAEMEQNIVGDGENERQKNLAMAKQVKSLGTSNQPTVINTNRDDDGTPQNIEHNSAMFELKQLGPLKKEEFIKIHSQGALQLPANIIDDELNNRDTDHLNLMDLQKQSHQYNSIKPIPITQKSKQIQKRFTNIPLRSYHFS